MAECLKNTSSLKRFKKKIKLHLLKGCADRSSALFAVICNVSLTSAIVVVGCVKPATVNVFNSENEQSCTIIVNTTK